MTWLLDFLLRAIVAAVAGTFMFVILAIASHDDHDHPP